jgi:hypothetical protein
VDRGVGNSGPPGSVCSGNKGAVVCHWPLSKKGQLCVGTDPVSHLAGLLLSMLLDAFSAGARSDKGMLARYLEKRSKLKIQKR